jgi:hypothetical protein
MSWQLDQTAALPLYLHGPWQTRAKMEVVTLKIDLTKKNWAIYPTHLLKDERRDRKRLC